MLRELFDWVMEKLGYISEKEAILRSVNGAKRARARQISKKLASFSGVSNVNEYLDLGLELVSIFKEEASSGQIKSKSRRVKDYYSNFSLINASDVYGYKPAMSRIYTLFAANPFGAYAYIARHHPAVRSCIDVILNEIINDGFVLISEKGTSKKRLKDVYRKLKSLGIPELRTALCKHLKLYGNAWILPHSRNLLGGKVELLQLLSPPRVLPDIDPITDRIRGWLYRPGPGRGFIDLPYDKVLHLRLFSVDDYRPLGDPPLGPAILDIEADMNATAFNNQVFLKGGLMGIFVSVKLPPSDDPFEDDSEDAAEDLQERIDSQFSGSKAGQAAVVSPNIDKVWNVNPIGKLDSSFQTCKYETAKTIAVCLGLPPEKISVSRSQTLQYIPSLVEDSVNTQFDKAINSLIGYVDDFINDYILVDILKITDIRIMAGGRYGSLTKNAADTIKQLADAGPLITVNDALDRILGWEPLPADNPRGRLVLDNSLNRKIDSVPLGSDPEKENMDLGKAAKVNSITSDLFIKWCETKEGAFETIDKTYEEDEETLVHRAIIKGSQVKYYEDYRKKNKRKRA